MKNKKHIWLTIATGFSALLITSSVIGVVAPLLMSDGTEKYTGVERTAAEAAIQFANQYNEGTDAVSHFGTLKIHVESVGSDNPDSASADTLCNATFSADGGANTPDRYLVTFSYRTVFGVQTGTGVAHTCGVDR